MSFPCLKLCGFANVSDLGQANLGLPFGLGITSLGHSAKKIAYLSPAFYQHFIFLSEECTNSPGLLLSGHEQPASDLTMGEEE